MFGPMECHGLVIVSQLGNFWVILIHNLHVKIYAASVYNIDRVNLFTRNKAK